MATFAWYWRRLRGMGPREVAWRTRALVRDGAGWLRVVLPVPQGLRRRGASTVLSEAACRVSDLEVGEWNGAAPGSPEAGWRDRAVAAADRAAAHRLTFLGLEDAFLGDPIDWNRDHDGGRRAPLRFSAFVDYRSYALCGDAKLVWEPNRHQHLVALARAYRATGRKEYAEELAAQLRSWLDQCPFGRGMNWRSPLELAIRLINWVWSLDLVRESGVVEGGLQARLARAAEQHVDEIAGKYSRGSSANNHRIGEAAGVFVATSYWPQLKDAARRREESRRMLCEEILAQTYDDGGTREQAVGYHLFVLQFLLVAAVVARRTGQELSPAFGERLQRMLEFLGALGEGGDALPMVGDADDGIVLDLGDGRDPAGWLATGAALFNRPDLRAWTGGCHETERWLLGRRVAQACPAVAAPVRPLVSRAFPDSGYYLLQNGGAGAPDAVSLIVDAGELGFGTIAAHGHADALSFVLRVGGRDVLVDPGTYDYFRDPAWRRYFRTTRAHNTVSVDGLDQSVIEGPFLWGRRARTVRLAWEPSEGGGRVVAQHDGYGRLADPVLHRRAVTLEGLSLLVEDEIEAAGEHEVTLHFHFSEHCRLQSIGDDRLRLDLGVMAVQVELDPRLSLTAVRGSEDPIAGWVSRSYHHKAPAVTVAARALCRGHASFATRIRIDLPPRPAV